MQTLIPLDYYYSSEKFALEQEKLFAQQWIFIGFTTQLANNNDFLCFTLAGKSVVVRNFNNELKAFHNVCSHRFSQICLEPAGNAPFQCPYHGWAYNKDGIPKGIPSKQRFSDLDVKSLQLKAYQVATCGKFVFVNLDPKAISLTKYLGDTATLLQTISAAMAEEIDCNEMIIDSNWKSVVENTLEDYHVHMVHPESFYQLGIKASKFNFSGLHSSAEMELKSTLEASPKIDAAFANRPFKLEGYIHQLIFPNLTLATAFGTTFSIQAIIPLSASQTRFISYVFATQCDTETSKNKALIKAFNLSTKEFNRQVFAEDKIICEAVQRGMMEADRKVGLLSQDEERIYAFQQHYQNCCGVK